MAHPLSSSLSVSDMAKKKNLKKKQVVRPPSSAASSVSSSLPSESDRPASPLPSSLPRSTSSLSYRSLETARSRSASPAPASPAKPQEKGNVKVVVRVRPFVDREVEKNAKCLIRMDPVKASTTIEQTMGKNGKPKEPREFFFDQCYWSLNPEDHHFADQTDVYNDLGKEFLDHNMQGYNTCIFAYGQTGSGKSYTMMGNDASPGIIPRTCEDLFEQIEQLNSGTQVTCAVRISYFEVYNEQVRDLLVKKASKLRVRESPTDGPYVEDLSEFAVQNVDQVIKYLQIGNRARATASTKMNDSSSRSHAVFTLMIRQVAYDAETDTTEERTSRLRLVDLAGSERANASGAEGARLKEGSNINKSLTTLGRVIAALASNSDHRTKQVIPYRDSVLTWILKESLGGNSKTAMVACISPTDYEETLSTLRYADQAKQIKTRAIINQDVVSAEERDKLVEEMQEQINTLQNSLSHYSTQQKEEEQFKSELEKVRRAVRYYEERAILEENKRKAIQLESMAIARHNRLLKDHLNEVTNRTVLGEMVNISDVSNVSYDGLKHERDLLLSDITSFKTKLGDSRRNFESRMLKYGITA